jgi:hypothetical protein
VSAEESSWNILEIEQKLVRLGLPFLLEHPGRSMLIYLKKMGKRLRLLFLALLIVFYVGLSAADDLSAGNGTISPNRSGGVNPFGSGKYWVHAFWIAMVLVAIYAMWRIGRAIMPTLRLWARVGSTLALLFGFVTFYFFTGDAWRFFGGMEWWRLVAFTCFFAAIALLFLYSHAGRAVQDAENESRDDPAKFMLAANQIFPDTSAGPPERQDLPSDGLAGFNLRAVVTLLLARRILVSGFIVLLVLLFFGMVMIDQHATQSLMHPPSAVGWSRTLSAGGRGFFFSEALVKVALSVGGLATAYFVVITLTDDARKAPHAEETAFIQDVSVLWSSYKGKSRRREAVTPLATEDR